ncbi:MAG: endonuclease/exonuclease/phosphatase family protein [Planctomycetia bacterium]|nr:endonuclease/exonuclease/phosphatase family protein [Planctomycetia bacterium]
MYCLLLCSLFLPAPKVDASLKVMSFNIRYGTANDGENHWNKRKEFLCETIKKFNPDLLGTQETLAFQRDYLLKELNQFEAFGVGRDDGKLKGEMAALFYRRDRFNLIEGGHFWLSPTPDIVGSKGWDAALPRIATWVKLKDLQHNDAKPVLFLNTHFDHMGKQARTESALLIRQKLEELGNGHTIIVTGDFNTGESTEPYQALFANSQGKPASIIDTFRIKHPLRGKEEGTFNGFKPDVKNKERIDWIGCSIDLHVKDAAIDHTTKAGKVPSDHFPVTAILVRDAVK